MGESTKDERNSWWSVAKNSNSVFTFEEQQEIMNLVNDADRLAQYERDLEHDGQDRSQDTEWLRRGFLQRGAEIERLEDEIRALAQTIESDSDRYQQSWRNGASLHYEGRADQAADDADRLRALLREDNPPRSE